MGCNSSFIDRLGTRFFCNDKFECPWCKLEKLQAQLAKQEDQLTDLKGYFYDNLGADEKIKPARMRKITNSAR